MDEFHYMMKLRQVPQQNLHNISSNDFKCN